MRADACVDKGFIDEITSVFLQKLLKTVVLW